MRHIHGIDYRGADCRALQHSPEVFKEYILELGIFAADCLHNHICSSLNLLS